MEFGLHAFVWTEGRTQADLEAALEKTKEAGFDFLELPGLDRKAFDLDRLARRAASLKLKMTASAGLPPAYDVTSADPEVVKRGEAFLAEAVSVARDLGCSQMSGPIFSAHQKFTRLPTREGWKTSAGVLARVAEKAKAGGVALCLELVNRYETNLMNTVKQGVQYIKDSGSDNLFLHIDTFHMNIEEADPAQAIRFGKDYIGYFHVGESNRGFLGVGSIDFAPIFDALLDIGYSKNVGVEAFDVNSIGDELKAICAIWRDVIDDNVAFARHSKTFLDAQVSEARRRRGAYKTALSTQATLGVKLRRW
jgi:D-psicose/D-tagatose/L-ribulose 3-epimerase